MKKLLLMMIVLLVSGAILAQGSAKTTATKSVLAFHAGPSFLWGILQAMTLTTNRPGLPKQGLLLI